MPQFSIRQSLLLGLSLLVLLTSGAILVLSVLGAFRASEALTREVVDEAAALVTTRVETYFQEVERSLRVVAAWGRTEDLGPSDTDEWEALLQPLIDQTPRVSSAMVANGAGAELMILQDPADRSRWTLRRVNPARWRGLAVFRETGRRPEATTEETVPLAYDTVRRLYFQTALTAPATGAPAWTPPSVFFTTRDPGMTAAVHWIGAAGDTTVVALDVLLLDVSRMTAGTEISPHGIVAAVTDDESPRVIGLPRVGGTLDDAAIRARLLPASGKAGAADTRPDLPVAGAGRATPLDAAVSSWKAAGRPLDRSFSFPHRDEPWWARFTRTHVGDTGLVVVAAAPRSDFVGGMAEDARRIALAALLALIAASVVAVRMARGYARPLEALATASRRLQSLDLTPTPEIDTQVREIRELAGEQERTRAALDSFARYMPVEIVRDLVARGVAAKLGGERRVITIVFSDIIGFSSIAERHSAEEVTDLLTDYFELLLDTIRAHQGEVNELLGDGVVAYWGAPVALDDHAGRAVGAILDCQERLEAWNAQARRAGTPPLPTSFGVATGEVVVGNIGSASRLAYKAIGDTANLASRIEGLNRIYGTRLLVAGPTHDLAGDLYEWREVDVVRVKGRGTPTSLYEPLGRRGEVPPERLAQRDRYEAALRQYRRGAFDAALGELAALSRDAKDVAAERLERLLHDRLQAGALPADWDGVTTYATK